MDTLEAKVGQQLIVGLPGPTLTAELAAHLRAIHAGGVIPFARNFESPKQLRRLIAQIREVLGPTCLVAIDHEGGSVIRLASGVTRFADQFTIGARGDAEAVRRQGEIEAKELRALGININLAPCVDVLVTGSDPIIGTRSYGSDPALVSRMAVARIQGLQQNGVAACAKHFPGLGAVPKDPHTYLPTVELEWEAMRTVHLAPFRAAITAGVASLMSSHVCYPRLEGQPGMPATFSPRLIRTLIREELRFDGVVFSDDMDMGALRELCPKGEAAVRAIEAGHDLLLFCGDVAAQREAFSALVAAYRQRRVSPQELENSCARVAALKRVAAG